MAIFGLVVFLSLITVSYSVKCMKCESTQGDCVQGICDGVWCTALILENKSTGSRILRKGCASDNPSNNKEEGCAKDPTPDGSDSYRCGCNSGDFCASENNIVRMQNMLNNRFIIGGGGGGLTSGQSPNFQTGQQSQGTANQFPPLIPNIQNPNNTFNGQFPNINPNLPIDLSRQQQGSPNSFNQPGTGQFPSIPNNNNNLQTGQNPQIPNLNNNVNPQFPSQNSGNTFQVGTNSQFPSQNAPGGQLNPNQQFPTQNNAQSPFQGSNIAQGPIQVSNTQNTQPTNAQFPQGNNVQPTPSNPNAIANTNPNRAGDGHFGNNNASGSFGGNQPSSNIDAGSVRTSSTGSGSGLLTCACSEPACNGPCKGAACYAMTFPAERVQNQAFSGRQGNVEQFGCTDDISIFPGGTLRFNRSNVSYRFRLGQQDVVVPAQAVYCREGDYCNTQNGSAIKSSISATFMTMAILCLFVLQRF